MLNSSIQKPPQSQSNLVVDNLLLPNKIFFDANNNNVTIGGGGGGGHQTNQKSAASKPPTTPSNSEYRAQFSAKSVDDETYFAEEDKGDCVYVITYKKVYNKGLSPKPSYANINLQSGIDSVRSYDTNHSNHHQRQLLNSQTSTSSMNNSPFGTFRILTPTFCVPEMNGGVGGGGYGGVGGGGGGVGGGHGDGLVYSRVKTKQLKYATLEKFIENFTTEEKGELDSNLVQTFLATYRTFTDTQTVLRLLKQR